MSEYKEISTYLKGDKSSPYLTYDKVRYADTDRQGHVNNANFSTFLETGRTELLYSPECIETCRDSSFVIASLNIDYKSPIHWSGLVIIETLIKKIGNSSMILHQRLYQNEILSAEAVTSIVQVDDATQRSKPLTKETREFLEHFLVAE